MYRLLYPNLMVITNGKSTVGAHGKKQPKHNTKVVKSHEERRKEKAKKKPTRNNSRTINKIAKKEHIH